MPVLDRLPPGSAWLAILLRPSLHEFALAFSPALMLQGSVLRASVLGAPAVRAVFDATRSMYDRIGFTDETRVGGKTSLEWEGAYRGLPIFGLTILDHDSQGRIDQIRLFHQPYDQIVCFAADLYARLASMGDKL